MQLDFLKIYLSSLFVYCMILYSLDNSTYLMYECVLLAIKYQLQNDANYT